MFDFWRVYISLHFDAVRSFGPWGCWSNGACMAFFVSSGFAPPCGSGCWLCATCHIGVATTGSVQRFSLRCQLVSGWRWYCFHMTFSWSFHQTNLAWKGLLEHLDFYTRILQYFKSCCSWLICFFCFGNGAFWSCFVEIHPWRRTASSRWSRWHFGFSSFAAFGLRARMCSPRPSLQPPKGSKGYGATAWKRRRKRSNWSNWRKRRTMKAIQDGLFRHVSRGPKRFPQFGVKHHIQNSGWRVFCSNKRWHWWRKPGWDPGKVIYNL